MPNANPPQSQPRDLPGTRIETDDEIEQALREARARQRGKAQAGNKAPPSSDGDAALERPVQRPPVPHLCILDDGKLDGEWVRLRGERHVIGRTEGDVLIPHDSLISSAHAEIVRHNVKPGYRWLLRDLDSTNGTWVRISSTPLRHGSEILIGGAQFVLEGGEDPAASGDEPRRKSTRAWVPEVASPLPSWVEITAAGPGARTALTRDEYWVGRKPTCAIVRRDDPLADPRHARLYRDAKGRWHIENNKSVNGLWFRIAQEIALGVNCQFRLGEQRFLFRVN